VYTASFELESFEAIPVECRCALVIALTEALASINLRFLRHMVRIGRQVPPLYGTGVRYGAQKMGRDRWQDIPRLLITGAGACEDLAAWRAAELRMFGEAAPIDVETFQMRDGSVIYHVVIKRANGSREDPSAALGMTHTTQVA
jgi:hypothetical protein